jgi:hypothetical protein
MLECIQTWVVAVPNPYAIEQVFAVAVLVVAASLWAAVKPPPVMVIRVPAGIAAVVTLCAVLASIFAVARTPVPACKLALQASLLLTSGLVAELVAAWRRERIPRAVARWFR